MFKTSLQQTKRLPYFIGLLLTIFTAIFSTHTAFADSIATNNKSLQETPAATSPVTRIIIACEEEPGQDHDDFYYSNLLKLVLTKTIPSHGDYELVFSPVMPIANRLLREIERGSVDVTWMPYSRNLKYALSPVKIRLLKNLSDYRVFLVRSQDVEKFANVKNLMDLRYFKGGMGSHWPDRYIMEENGLPLVLSMDYFNLFKMLKSKRFDYFSRGVYQVRSEVDAYADQGISLEKHLFLRYENPVYFYVHKDNKDLAERLEAGLKIAIEDGSFNELFNRVENLQWGEKLLGDQNRRIIQLNTFNR